MRREKSGKADVQEKAVSRYNTMIGSFDFILCEVGSYRRALLRKLE